MLKVYDAYSLSFVFSLVALANESLDIKVKSSWPNQILLHGEPYEYLEPEHILIKKARSGVNCRLGELEMVDLEKRYV